MSHPAQNQGFIRDYELPAPEPDSRSHSPVRPRKPYRFGTLCATVDNPDQKDQYGSSSVPIYQTATFKGVDGQYDYTRSGNPTRSHLGEYLIYSAGQGIRRLYRTSHRQDIVSRPCIRRLFRDGRSRCHSPSSQAR
jgi:Cys/Met metabolism PLP-dependent enzyme